MGSTSHKKVLLRVLMAAAIVAAAGYWYWSVHQQRSPANIVRISGTVEADQTNVSVVTAGRIASVSMQDGEPVRKGQVLLRLDAEPLQVKLNGADSTISLLDQQRRELAAIVDNVASRLRNFSVPQELASKKTNQYQQIKPGDDKEDLDAAMLNKQVEELHKLEQAQLEGLNEAFKFQQAALEQACVVEHKAIKEAYTSGKKALAEAARAGSVPCHKIWPLTLIDKQKQKALKEIIQAKDESVEAKHKAAVEAVDSGIKANAEALQQGYCTKQKAIKEIFSAKEDALKTVIAVKERADDMKDTVQSKLASVNAQVSKAMAVPQGLLATARAGELQRILLESRTRLATLEVQIAQALANRQEILDKHRDFVVVSPIDGICASSNVSAGEVCAAGQTLGTLVDTKNIYLRGFVSEGLLSRIKVGQPAFVFLDGQKQPLRAQVAAIDPRASFTPETVVTRESRVREVFGVRLRIFDATGIAKPGVPAEAEIVVQSLN